MAKASPTTAYPKPMIAHSFKNERPKSAEDENNIQRALQWTYDDILNRHPDIFAGLEPTRVKTKYGEEYDVRCESYLLQWNRLQLMHEERAARMFAESINPLTGKKWGTIGRTNKGRISKSQKQFNAVVPKLKSVQGEWLNGFDDWSPPPTDEELEREEEQCQKRAGGTQAS